MILSCPSCQGRYLVPATHFAAGPRMVRCARCAHTWLAEVPPDPATAFENQLSALVSPAESAVPATPTANLPIVQDEVKPFWLCDWVLAMAAMTFAGLLLFLALDRKDIAHRWPVTESIYDRVGLHIYHVGEGLSLRQVRSEMRFDSGTTELAVDGQVHNDTDKQQTIPDILAAAIGPDGKPMQSWQIDAPAATVAPGDSVPFTSAIHAPKGTVAEINLHFVELGNAP